MKCRMIVPVGLLTWLVCLGGVNASPFALFRLAGEEAIVEVPPVEMNDDFGVGTQKWGVSQKGKLPAQKGAVQKGPVQKPCGPVQKDCGPVQKVHEPFLWAPRARLRMSHAWCEPACGPVQKGAFQKGPVQKECGPIQKDFGPVQKVHQPLMWATRARVGMHQPAHGQAIL